MQIAVSDEQQKAAQEAISDWEGRKLQQISKT
jgi:hypothetical protein